MRISFQLLWASLLIVPDLLAQSHRPWVDAEYQGHWPAVSADQSRVPADSSIETEDDPTLSADAYGHVPVIAARKAMERAERLSRKERHNEAIKELRRALAIDPQYYRAENDLAVELETTGDVEAAIATLERLTESAPDRALAFNTLAQIFWNLRRYSDMERVAGQAIKDHPFSFRANFLWGNALAQQGRWSPEAKHALSYAALKYPEAKTLLDQWPAQ